MNKNSLRGSIFVFLSTLFFGSYGIWARLIGPTFGDFFQAYSRSLMVLLIIIPIGLIFKQYKKVDKNDLRWILTVSMAGALTFAPYFYALKHLPIGTSAFLFYAALTISSYIFGKLSFKEEFGIIKILSLVLGLAGLLMIFSFSLQHTQILPALSAIFGGIMGSCEVVFSKKVSSKYSSLQLTTSVFLMALLVNLPLSLIMGEKQIMPSLDSHWLGQVGYMTAQLGAFTLVVLGYKYLEPSVGAIIGLLEIVFAVIFGRIIFGEILGYYALLGGALIVISAALPNIPEEYLLLKKGRR